MESKKSTKKSAETKPLSKIEIKLQKGARELEMTSDELISVSHGKWLNVTRLRIEFVPGGLPEIDLRMLSSFPNLTYLMLLSNGKKSPQLADLTGIENCLGLKKLYLNKINLESFNGLEFCQEMSQIHVYHLTCGTGVLQTLPKLKSMTIEYTKNLPELLEGNSWEAYPKLTSLTLDGCPIADVSCLAGLRVQKLSLMRCRLETIEGLEMDELVELNLSCNDITDISPLDRAIKLKKLNIGTNKIQDLGPLERLLERKGRSRPTIKCVDCYKGTNTLLKYLTDSMRRYDFGSDDSDRGY